MLVKAEATLPDDREQHLVHAISHVSRPEVLFSDAPKTPAIRQACWNERALAIDYVDHTGGLSRRKIYPLPLMYTDQAMTLLAWSRLREGFRMFRVDRVQTHAETGESFRPRRAPLLREYLAELHRRDAPRDTSACIADGNCQ